MAEKLPYVLEILTATEVPCKGWQVHVDTEGGNRTWAQTELKPFIFDNVQVLFSPWNLSHVQTLFLLSIVFYLSCGKTLVLHTKESTHELTVFFPRMDNWGNWIPDIRWHWAMDNWGNWIPDIRWHWAMDNLGSWIPDIHTEGGQALVPVWIFCSKLDSEALSTRETWMEKADDAIVSRFHPHSPLKNLVAGIEQRIAQKRSLGSINRTF